MKLNGTYSSWSEVLLGVMQGPILGPLSFNMFLFLFQFFPDVDIANYADDSTPHSSNINLNKVLHDLEKISNTLFKWFTDNLLKANPEKSHLLTNSTQEIQINIGEIAISNSKCFHNISIFLCSTCLDISQSQIKQSYKPHSWKSLENCIPRP